MSLASNLEATLNNEIPLTKALGIRVESASSTQVCLKAPLENNTNHKSTAFGGSLYSVAVLTGWSLVHIMLKQQEINAHIVIHHSEIDYLMPVQQDFTACCEIESNRQLEKFLATYQRKGKARLTLTVVIKQAGKVAVWFKGQYVVHQ